MPHLDESTIHAWLDGALDVASAAAAESHVDACADCASAVAEARGLIAASSRILSALDHVPGGVLPGTARDGWNPKADPNVTSMAVAAGASSEDSRGKPVRRRTSRRWSAPHFAAAAVLIMAVGSYAVLRSGGERVALNGATAERAPATTAPSLGGPDSATVANPAAQDVRSAPSVTEREAAGKQRAGAVETASRELVPIATSARAAAAPELRDTIALSAKMVAADQMTTSDSVAANMPLPSTARLRSFAPVESRAQSLAVGADALALEPSAWAGRCFQAAIEPAAVSPGAVAEFSRLSAALPPEFRLDSAVIDERGESTRFAAVPVSSADSTVTGWWSVAGDTGVRVEFNGAATGRVQLTIAPSAADWPATRAELYINGSRRSSTLSVQLTPVVCAASPAR